jgi:hypothetical protein
MAENVIIPNKSIVFKRRSSIKRLFKKLRIILLIILVKGCKGDRTPMYRAFAPFFAGVRGDRRVTGMEQE